MTAQNNPNQQNSPKETGNKPYPVTPNQEDETRQNINDEDQQQGDSQKQNQQRNRQQQQK